MTPCRACLLVAVFLPALTLANETVTVAVASNFHVTAKEIAMRFEESTGIDVRLSPGSTGKLYAQIVNGAPYDVFLAADIDRPQKLVEAGLAASESYFEFAVGRLVLWSANSRFEDHECLDELRRGNYKYLAIANPETAPYGAAARKFLKDEGLWDDADGKLVYGENIAQTFQFVATGNATFGLIAASQLYAGNAGSNCVLRQMSDGRAAPEVRQAGVVLARSKARSAATRFRRFMQTTEVRELIQRHGYSAVAEPIDEVR